MACAGCEERRQKLKAIANDSAKSIANAIARLVGRVRKAEPVVTSAEQSIDSTEQSTDQFATGTNTTEQRVATATRRTRKPK